MPGFSAQTLLQVLLTASSTDGTFPLPAQGQGSAAAPCPAPWSPCIPPPAPAEPQTCPVLLAGATRASLHPGASASSTRKRDGIAKQLVWK